MKIIGNIQKIGESRSSKINMFFQRTEANNRQEELKEEEACELVWGAGVGWVGGLPLSP